MPGRLVTAEDVALYLNTTVAALGEDRIELFIDLAGGLIRTEIDQLLDETTGDTIVIDADGTGIVLLPELPVNDVLSVETTVGGTTTALVEDDDYVLELGDDGRLGIIRRLPRGAVWALGTKIAVEYDHGYVLPGESATSDLPDTIRAAVLRTVARGLPNPTGSRQRTMGRYSETTGGTETGLYLTAGDKRDLDPFKPGNRGGAT